MSTYTVTTNFANKDLLPSGSSDKVIKGAEFTTEFNNIATAVNSKVDTTTYTVDIASINTALSGKVNSTGGTITGTINFSDSAEAHFGNDSDLRIFHNGTNSYVADYGTGNLILLSDGAGVAFKTSTDEPLADFINDGAVNLYYDSVKKFNTTVSGVNVTGLSIGGTSITATATELNYVDGVTSNIQDQLNALSTGGSYVSTTDADYVKLTEITLTSSQINAIWARINDLEHRVLDLEEGGL